MSHKNNKKLQTQTTDNRTRANIKNQGIKSF